MDFLVTLALYSNFFTNNNFDGFTRNDAYCQNAYWQPHSLEEMHIAGCDVTAVEKTIHGAMSGKY